MAASILTRPILPLDQIISGTLSVRVYYSSVAKQRTVNHDSLLSAVLISTLSIVRGHLATPTKMNYVDPDLSVGHTKRWFECPNYDECLNIAAKARWSGWTCSKCKVFKTLPPLKYQLKAPPSSRQGPSMGDQTDT